MSVADLDHRIDRRKGPIVGIDQMKMVLGRARVPWFSLVETRGLCTSTMKRLLAPTSACLITSRLEGKDAI